MDILLQLSDDPSLDVEFGRTGVKALTLMADGIKNGAAPKAVTTYMEPESLTAERGYELLAEKRAKGPTTRKRAARKSNDRRTPAKKTATKGGATKATATKSAAKKASPQRAPVRR